MSPGKNVVYIDKARSEKANGNAPYAIFKAIHKLVIDKINISINQVFSAIDDSLFTLAEKATASSDHQNFFASMRDVRCKKKDAISKYCQSITSANQNFLSNKKENNKQFSDQVNPSDDFSLLEHNQLELTLALENIISKANLRSSKEISAIEARLGELFPDKFIDEETNPLSPKNLTTFFFNACKDFDIDDQSELVIYKQFDKVIASEFQDLYIKINELLVKNGVLPDLKNNKLKKEAANTTNTPQKPAPSDSKNVAETLSSDDEDLINVLYELLAQRRGVESFGDSSGSSKNTTGSGVQPSALIQSLSTIQTERFHSQQNGIDSPDSIKDFISHNIQHTAKPGASVAFSQIQSDTIDITSMLFEFILGDSNIPDNIKALIGRLQIPVLKVAVIDKTFFNRANHPARALINELAGAAIGVQSESLTSKDQLLQKTEVIVNKILTEFTDNVSIFEELLLDFRDFLLLEQKRSEAIEKKTRDVEESKVKVENAKALVQTETSKRLKNIILPDSISHLITDVWSKFLFITYLKEGEESEAWTNGLNTIDTLIWSLTPKDTDDAKVKLLSVIPKVQRELREGMNNILFNPFEITKIFQDLESKHIDNLTATNDLIAGINTSEETVDDFIDPQPAPVKQGHSISETLHTLKMNANTKKKLKDEKANESHDMAVTKAEYVVTETEDSNDDIEETPLLKEVNEIEIGTWFEFTQDDNEKIRAKLSARLRNGERLIFVNRSGFKMAEKSSEQLAYEIKAGLSTILNDSLLFDRALESVITDLKEIKSSREKIHPLR